MKRAFRDVVEALFVGGVLLVASAAISIGFGWAWTAVIEPMLHTSAPPFFGTWLILVVSLLIGRLLVLGRG